MKEKKEEGEKEGAWGRRGTDIDWTLTYTRQCIQNWFS